MIRGVIGECGARTLDQGIAGSCHTQACELRRAGSFFLGTVQENVSRVLLHFACGEGMDPVDRDDVEARELKNLVHGSCTLAKYDQGYLLSSQA